MMASKVKRFPSSSRCRSAPIGYPVSRLPAGFVQIAAHLSAQVSWILAFRAAWLNLLQAAAATRKFFEGVLDSSSPNQRSGIGIPSRHEFLDLPLRFRDAAEDSQRTAFGLSSSNHRSTKLSQLELVGMKCRTKRGCLANHRRGRVPFSARIDSIYSFFTIVDPPLLIAQAFYF